MVELLSRRIASPVISVRKNVFLGISTNSSRSVRLKSS